MSAATFPDLARDRKSGAFQEYQTEVTEGMVVLDVIHKIQAEQANDMAVRWNCKAGKCGSCSAEINGMPKLMCMTRMNTLPADKPVRVEPMKTFPLIRDLVTDVSWNYEVKKTIRSLKPRKAGCAGWKLADAAGGMWIGRRSFGNVLSVSFAKDVCHVLRDHHMHSEFIGPRFLVYAAALECIRWITEDRLKDLKDEHGIGLCNITKCCTKVCPEHITITDNAIIPLKERVVDEFFRSAGRVV